MAKNLLLTDKYIVIGRDFEHGGEASSKIKNELKRLGISSDIIRNISIASYEAEMNIIIYAKDGTMTLEVYSNKIKIIAEDIGPGISDIELAMKEGYSTAPPEVIEMGFGAGMGLPNIKKNSDTFRIDSVIGKGTKLIFEVNLR
jgi:serine/threonine-protein kinase RsbT